MPGVASTPQVTILRHSYRLQAGFFFIAGCLVGLVAFAGTAQSVLIAALVPISTRGNSRAAAFLLWMGYYLTAARDVPVVVSRFFPDWPGVLGFVIWLGHASVLSGVWALFWRRPGGKVIQAVCLVMLAMVIHLLPPFGLISWVSPWVSAGALFPGTGFLGLELLLFLIAILCLPLTQARTLMVISLVFLSLAINVTHRNPVAPSGWTGMNTALGRMPDDVFEQHQRQRSLAAGASGLIREGYKVVVLPEEVAGVWRKAIGFDWQDLETLAHKQSATVLVGADVFLDEGIYTNSLIRLGHEAGSKADARIPIPFGSWRWWKPMAHSSVLADGTSSIHGVQVALSFCYEDLLAWPHVIAFLSSSAPVGVMVSVANNWFGDGLDEPRIQAATIGLWARLYGVPMVRAVNNQSSQLKKPPLGIGRFLVKYSM